MIIAENFLFGLLGFLSLVCFQILWWRLRVRFTILAMFGTFLILPLAVFCLTGERAGSLLLLSLCLSYLFGFPAVVAKSPSLEILKLVHQCSAQGGASKEAIVAALAKEDLLRERMNDLIQDGMVRLENGKVKMRLFGKMVGAVFYYYRKLLGLAQGRG